MRRRLWFLLPFVLLVPACSGDDSPAIDGSAQQTTSSSTTSTTASPGSTTSTTAGTTSDGTPLSGPAGTSGTFRYTLAAARSELCYRISIAGAGTAKEAHLHRQSGENVLTLTPPGGDGKIETCAATDSLLLDEIQARPSQFYVDVHADKGVLKGQLG